MEGSLSTGLLSIHALYRLLRNTSEEVRKMGHYTTNASGYAKYGVEVAFALHCALGAHISGHKYGTITFDIFNFTENQRITKIKGTFERFTDNIR